MAETIESFVAKLRQEGVEAGRAAAEQHLAKARQEADVVLADARAKAARIVQDAQAQAEGNLAKGRTDLELAARDVAMRLRETLGRAVREVLAAATRQQLSDPEFLKTLLHDVVIQYAQADIEAKSAVKINVAPDMQAKLADWTMALMHKPELHQVTLDLQGTLAEAGFEYQVGGANVEVTVDSVTEALSDLVSPGLREILQRAMAEDKR
jgi:V/A-type H+-transporting ATPase subunit E